MESVDKNNWIQALLYWFDQGNRQMPWRNTKDPYKRWVSEIMLQQTKVDTVIPYFNRFLERFPDVNSLASAEEDEVLKLWEGLGYYSRARNLLKAARIIEESYDGIFPATEKEALRLPGIGPYSAAAILSMAYDIALPSVDGNVMRVYSRIYGRYDNILEQAVIKQVRLELAGMIPFDRPGDFNESLMELGAVICLPGSPDCCSCPIEKYCQARSTGKERELPVRIKKDKKKILNQHVYVIWNEKKDAVLLRKNPSKGLLGGLWAFPTEKVEESNRELVQEKEIGYNIGKSKKVSDGEEPAAFDLKIIKKLGEAKHVFSHQLWNMSIYEARLETSDLTNHYWIPLSELKNLAFPEAYRKVFRKVPQLSEETGKE